MQALSFPALIPRAATVLFFPGYIVFYKPLICRMKKTEKFNISVSFLSSVRSIRIVISLAHLSVE